MIKKIIVFLTLALLLSSCVSRKKIAYFQNISSANIGTVNYETRLKADDQLIIIVSSPDPRAVVDFNLSVATIIGSTSSTLTNASPQPQYQTYIIDNTGNIEFPIIGTIKLGGLTRAEAIKKLKTEIEKYAKDPIINLRIINFDISVYGEVVRPGTFNIATERITLPEVISMAGDMTIYGNRHNVLIIREDNGQKTFNYVDMTQADFINSPYYYLTQNDQVYIEPNKTKINSAAIGPNIAVGISALSLVITIIALVTK